jgi:hypothetical protein
MCVNRPPQSRWKWANVEIRFEQVEPGSNQRFCENTNKLILAREELDSEALGSNLVSEKVIVNAYVLSSSMEC